MRESIGGAWLTGIVVTFLALFAAFLVYAVNYTKAFRVKDRIIHLIEENEGYTFAKDIEVKNSDENTLLTDGSTEAEIFYFERKIGYNYDNSGISCGDPNEDGILDTETYGYCVERHCVEAKNGNRVYYKVTSYIALKIPIINYTVKVPISGETSTMFFDTSGLDTCIKVD